MTSNQPPDGPSNKWSNRPPKASPSGDPSDLPKDASKDAPKDPADYGKAKKKQGHHAHLTAAADVLQVLLQNSKSSLSDGFLRWRLEQQWPEVVGATIAQQTLPVAFDKGTLFIWVRHPTWMQQLWYFQDVIRDKVNQHFEASGKANQWCCQVKFTLSRRAASSEQGPMQD